MKRILKLLILSVFSFVAVLSCKQDEKTPLSEIKLKDTELNVPAEEREYSITYSIVNPIEGANIAVSAEFSESSEWITSINTEIANIVKFKVLANEQEESRTATLTLDYANGSATVELVVNQAGIVENPEDLPFEIEVSDIGIETAKATIIPKDQEMLYATLCIDTETFNTTIGSDEDMFEAMVNKYWEAATNYGVSITVFLEQTLKSGEQALNVSGLKPGRSYYAIAVGMDTKAKQTSAMVKKEFSTKDIEMNGATFEISHENKENTTFIEVKPSSNSIYYYYDALKKSDIENSQVSLKESLEEFFYNQIMYSMTMFGISREETMKEMLHKGPSSSDFQNLYADTDYVLVATSVTLEGYVCSEMTEYAFRTPKVTPSDNQLSLALSDINVNSVKISITTTNSDRYCMMILPTADYPGMTPEQILAKIEGHQTLDSHVNSGNAEGTVNSLKADTEYIVMLFGYEHGRATTAPVSQTFRTLEDGNPEELQFDFDFSEITSTSVKVKTTPTPNNALYFAFICEASYGVKEVNEYVEYLAQIYISMGMAADKADFLKKMSKRGLEDRYYDNLFGDTEYKMFAFGVYPETGKIATEIVFSDTFRTLPREVSDVTINLISDKYFNGDEVAEAYSQYAAAKGRAAVPVKVETTGDVDKFFYHIFLNDLSDTEKYTDDSIIHSLVRNGGITEPEALFYCDYDATFTIIGVAKGKDGKYGNVYRRVMTPTKEGCSPIDEFVPINNAPAASMRLESAKPVVPTFEFPSSNAATSVEDNGIYVEWR